MYVCVNGWGVCVYVCTCVRACVCFCRQLTNCKDQLCSELEVARTDLEKQHAHLERQIKQLQQVENDARSLA